MLRRLYPVARFLARATLVVAAGLVVAGLVLAVASFHVMAAPFRWTREREGDRRARIEASMALATALFALFQLWRQSRAQMTPFGPSREEEE